MYLTEKEKELNSALRYVVEQDYDDYDQVICYAVYDKQTKTYSILRWTEWDYANAEADRLNKKRE